MTPTGKAEQSSRRTCTDSSQRRESLASGVANSVNLNPKSILRNSAKLSAANLLAVVLGFLTSVIVARQLGPELLGAIGLVTLSALYAGLVQPGAWSAAAREVPSLLAAGKDDEALRIQNVGLTFDIGFSIGPAVAMLVAAQLYSIPVVRYGLMLAAVAHVLNVATNDYVDTYSVRQRFGVVATIAAAAAMTSQVFTLTTVWWIGPYSVLLAPLIAVGARWAVIRWKGPRNRVAVVWDSGEIKRLLRVGLVLTALGLFYWGFRTVDRASVARWSSWEDLGYYTFVAMLINTAILLVSDTTKVLQPVLWARLGSEDRVEAVAPEVTRYALVLLLITCVLVNVGQALFAVLVYSAMPRFAPAVHIFDVLVFSVAATTAASVPNIILNSAAVQGQRVCAALWGVGLITAGALDYVILTQLNLGLVAVAWCMVATQLLVVVAQYGFIHRHLFRERKPALAFYGLMLAFLAIAAAVSILFQTEILRISETSTIHRMTLRLLLLVSIWGAMGVAVYRVWWRSSDVPTVTTAVARVGR